MKKHPLTKNSEGTEKYMKAIELERNIEYITTGLNNFDSLMGGGIQLGCITEIYGTPSVGKSTLALQIIAAAQKKKHPCLFADSEYSFTPQYAALLGVNNDSLDLTRMRLAEDTFDAIISWVEKHKRGLVVLDSMGGVLPREESEKGAEGKSIGLQSRLMAAFCRKIIGLLDENKCSLLVVNHEVTNIATGAIGSSGGAKLAFHKRYSVRLRPLFGKQASRATDGSKRTKPIEAELKKEKNIDTREGKKIELIFEAGRGFVNAEEVTQVKRGRPKATV